MISGTIKAEKFVNGLMPVTGLVDECVIDVNESGWKISAVDKAQIGLVSVEILDDLFMSYDCSACSIGVKNAKLVRVLELFSEYNSRMTVNTDESLSTLILDNGELEYEMDLLKSDLVDTNKEMPELETYCSISLDSSEFSRIASGATTVSDLISFKYRSSGEFVVVSEDESADFTYEVGSGEGEVLQTASSMYRSDYIDTITNTAPGDVELNIMFSDSYPFELQFSFEDENIDVKYIVAPRIDSSGGEQ